MAAPGEGGWNPRHGWDGGGPPVGQNWDTVNTAAGAGYYPGAYAQPQAPAQPFPLYTAPAYPYPPAQGYPYPDPRAPQPHPRVSGEVPGMNLVNSSGGAGCEPGYNYIFHHEHTKVHVFKSKEPPWRCTHANFSFAKFHVPTNTTLAELLQRFGAFNPNPRLNRITEVIEGGNGVWYRGNIFCGDEEGNMKKTLADVGWDRSRSGREKPVVWVWITKD